MRLGIDLGGTKIEIIALDKGREVLRERVATPQSGYEDTIHAMRDLVRSAEKSLGRRGSVGVAIPGTISPMTGLVKNANSTRLIGHPLGSRSWCGAQSAGARRQRRQLFHAVRGVRWRGRRCGHRLRHHRGHRLRRRRLRRRARADRRARHHRRMGPQSATKPDAAAKLQSRHGAIAAASAASNPGSAARACAPTMREEPDAI